MNTEVVVHRIVKEKKNPGQYIEPHSHTFFELLYGMKGTACVVIKEETPEGGLKDRIYDLEKGSLVIAAPGKVHAVYSQTVSISLSVKFTCPDSLSRLILSLPVCFPKVDESQDMLLRNMFEEAVNRLPDYPEMIDLRLCELLFGLHRAGISAMGRGPSFGLPPVSSRSVKLSEALDYIHTHIDGPLSVSEVAEVTGYHENYFSSYFKENVGCTPVYYITEKKMERARELMMFSDLSITDIAEKLGYDSIHYFSRVFKKRSGLTPMEFKKRVSAEQAVNVVVNENTPKGEYEIPLKDGPSEKEDIPGQG